MKYWILAIGIAFASAASSSAQQQPQPRGTTGTALPSTASASLTDSQGRGVGGALLQQGPRGVLLKLNLRNASPGVHGLHIHAVGRCDAPSFESAGGHFASSGRQHGFLHARGHHEGDLPNIEVPASTQLSVEYFIGDVTLDPGPRSLLDTDGAAIVIHAGTDDYM